MSRARRYDPSQVRAGILGLSAETVSYEGLTVPAGFTVRLWCADWPADVQLRIAVSPDLGPVAAGIEAIPHDDQPVSYRDADQVMRATFTIADMLREWTGLAVQMLAMDRLGARGEGESTEDATQRRETLLSARDAWQDAVARRRRRVTDDTLREVAETYRQAMAEGLPPTWSVAERFRVSHSTAARWVRRARDIGALGPAKGSTPGGQA